mmetsp:Transcript_272/g.1056  ORF Transcript_272/g.1056 Transcript_272/m.1056 type:complete len:317 (+) Transcript_272:70-1020(+)
MYCHIRLCKRVLLLLILLLRRAERIGLLLRRAERVRLVRRRRGGREGVLNGGRRRGLRKGVRHGTTPRGEQRLHLVPVGLDRLHHRVELVARRAHRAGSAVEALAGARGHGHLSGEGVVDGVGGGWRKRRGSGERILGGRCRLKRGVGAVFSVGDRARERVGLGTGGLERGLLRRGGLPVLVREPLRRGGAALRVPLEKLLARRGDDVGEVPGGGRVELEDVGERLLLPGPHRKLQRELVDLAVVLHHQVHLLEVDDLLRPLVHHESPVVDLDAHDVLVVHQDATGVLLRAERADDRLAVRLVALKNVSSLLLDVV